MPEEKLNEILFAIKDLREDMNKKFAMQDKKIEEFRKEVDEKFAKQRVEISKEIDEKFAKQRVEISKEIDEKLAKQSREISNELQQILQVIDKRFNKLEKAQKQFFQELRENKIAHDSYDARLYKIEVSQANLESKFYDSNKKLIAT